MVEEQNSVSFKNRSDCRFLLYGDSSRGKSALFTKFQNDDASSLTESHTYHIKKTALKAIGGKSGVKLEMQDNAQIECFKSNKVMQANFFKRANAVFLVYDGHH